MANKTYPLSSGKVYAGIPTSVPNDVSAGVWTPTTDDYGRILDASWANLPLNEFVAVAGSQPQKLTDYLISVGLNPATLEQGTASNLLPTFNAWVGAAVDQNTGRIFVKRGGGHVDSSINGVWEYNLEHVLGWTVFVLPSDPFQNGYEWVPEYRDSAASYTNYPTSTPTQQRFRTILPDGNATSAHTYAGCWFNYGSRTIETSRSARISYSVDVVGAPVGQSFWVQDGIETDTTINHWLFYDRVQDKIRGFQPKTDIDYFNFVSYPQNSNVMTKYASGFYTWSAVQYDRKIHCFGQNSAYRVFDCDLDNWESASQAVTWQSTAVADQESVACVYLPQLNKILRRWSAAPEAGRWALFNPATLVNEDWTPAGNVPPNTTWISNKYFYYERRKCLVCISANNMAANSIYIMRLE